MQFATNTAAKRLPLSAASAALQLPSSAASGRGGSYDAPNGGPKAKRLLNLIPAPKAGACKKKRDFNNLNLGRCKIIFCAQRQNEQSSHNAGVPEQSQNYTLRRRTGAPWPKDCFRKLRKKKSSILDIEH